MADLDELRLFAHLAESLHFTRTAAQCHVTQSTLSRTIARLERDVGRRLLDRDRRTVQLTADGVRLRDFALKALDGWDQLVSSWDDSEQRIAGPLSIFCTVTASQTLLPEALRRFREQYPDVTLRLETGYAAEALRALQDGVVDVSVAAIERRPPRGVLAHVLTTAELVPVGSRLHKSRLPARVGPDWSQVPWVLPAEGLARTLVDQWFRRLRVRPHVAAEAVGHEAVLALVALGCGIGMVPRLVAEKAPSTAGLRIMATDAPLATFDIAVCTLPERTSHPPVAALWRSLGQIAAPA